MGSNVEATRWLVIYLDTGLQFRTHKNISLGKGKFADDRVRGLQSIYGLEPRLIRLVQVAAVRAVALYGVEISWHSQKGWCERYQKLVNRQK